MSMLISSLSTIVCKLKQSHKLWFKNLSAVYWPGVYQQWVMICEAPRCVKIRVKRTNEPQSWCPIDHIFSSINDIFWGKVNTCFTIHDKWKVYFYNYLIVIFFLHGMAVLLMEKLLSNDCVECEKTRFSFRISASLSENVVASLQRKWFVAEWGAFPALMLKAWTISFL